MGIEAVVVLILIVANGFLAMSELAIVSARTARQQQMAVRGNRGSPLAIELAADPNRFLSSVQIGITLIGILNGAFGELMTPRHTVDMLDVTKSDAENRQRMIDCPHNIFPVCDGSPDNVIGIISARELWRRQLASESTGIRESILPALFLPELSPVFAAIDQMRQSRQTMALLIDEYGGFEGTITFNDILRISWEKSMILT